MRRLSLGLFLALGLPAALRAQATQAILEGFRARVTRGGVGLPSADSLRDTVIAMYPGVHFYYADLLLEHGGGLRLYGALDTAGQLYLLDSPASFRLLHLRHFQGAVDSATATRIAFLAARFSGILPPGARLASAQSLLLQAVAGDGRRVPYAWRVSLRAADGSSPDSVVFQIAVRDGMPVLRSRTCDDWCRTVILEP